MDITVDLRDSQFTRFGEALSHFWHWNEPLRDLAPNLHGMPNNGLEHTTRIRGSAEHCKAFLESLRKAYPGRTVIVVKSMIEAIEQGETQVVLRDLIVTKIDLTFLDESPFGEALLDLMLNPKMKAHAKSAPGSEQFGSQLPFDGICHRLRLSGKDQECRDYLHKIKELYPEAATKHVDLIIAEMDKGRYDINLRNLYERDWVTPRASRPVCPSNTIQSQLDME